MARLSRCWAIRHNPMWHSGHCPPLWFGRISHRLCGKLRRRYPMNLILETIERELSEGRIDHREQQVITIDGLDAKDLDDAIYLETRDGQYHLWVHIARCQSLCEAGDSSGYRKLCKEAIVSICPIWCCRCCRHRFPTDCQLASGVDRLTVTCRLRIERDGKVTDGEVYPSLINSCARLSYEVRPVHRVTLSFKPTDRKA